MSTRKRTSAKLSLIEFVRPVSDGYWPNPYSVEQAFELARWMLATGQAYPHPDRWVNAGVPWLLSASEGAIRIRKLEDLRETIHRGILGREQNDAHTRWRVDHNIRVDAEIVLPYRHNKPHSGAPYLGMECESDVKNELKAFLSTAAGTRMKAQLNSVHARAKVIHSVDINVLPDGFSFRVYFGFNAHRPGQSDSEWSHVLARTKHGETFLDTFARARHELARAITEPYVLTLDDRIAA